VDQESVRKHAESHAQAMAAGDLRAASGDLTDSGKAAAPAVMGRMPKPLDSAEVTGVEVDGDEVVALILYSGGEEQVTVKSRWAEEGGRPMIVDLEVIP
jgi:hypothetical protein